MKKVVKVLLAMTLWIPILTSCKDSKTTNWSYSKEEMSSFQEMEGNLIKLNGKKEFSVSSKYPILKTKIGTDDLRLFNYKNATEQLSVNGNPDFLSYDIINKNSLKINDVKTNDQNSSFTVHFNDEGDNKYGILVNKEVTNSGKYILAVSKETLLGSTSDIQTEFEEKYLTTPMEWKEGVEFVWDIACNVAMICLGVSSGSSPVVASGIIGIVNTTFGSLFSENGPTTKDVLNKLQAMDEKIDKISEKLDENYKQLSNSINRIAVKVDEVLLQQYAQNITGFVTDYVKPIDDYKRDLEDYYGQFYRRYVAQKEVINMCFTENDEGKYEYVPLLKENPSSQKLVQINIEDFAKSKEFLNNHSDTVSEGFIDALYKDIDKAIRMIYLPDGIDAQTARECAAAHIVEEINQEYYTNNHQKALDLRNLVINYSKRISGKLGVGSAITDYVERLKHMFNFGSELKPQATGLLSNYLFDLDRNAAIAAEACAYARTDSTELSNEYKTARNTIQNNYQVVKNIADNQSFVLEKNIDCGFYQAKFNTYYTNPGNDATLHANFELKRLQNNNPNDAIKVDTNSIDFVSVEEHSQINARRKLLIENGVILNRGYLEYIRDTNILDRNSYYAYYSLKANKWISDDATRFATELSVRSLTEKDKEFDFHYSAKGCDGSALFNENWYGKYQSKLEKANWDGKIVETTYIDAITGTEMVDKRVAAYASYHESHWYWSSDEIWAFVDNPSGNYMFIMNKVI